MSSSPVGPTGKPQSFRPTTPPEEKSSMKMVFHGDETSPKMIMEGPQRKFNHRGEELKGDTKGATFILGDITQRENFIQSLRTRPDL